MVLLLGKQPSDSHSASSAELENLVPFSQRVNSFKAIHGFVRAEESRKSITYVPSQERPVSPWAQVLPLPSSMKGSFTMGL